MSRARPVLVVVTLAAAGLALMASTQAWFWVTLGDAPDEALEVMGSAAVPVLTPLSIAVLATAAALSIAGRVLAWVFGALLVAIGAVLCALIAPVAFEVPLTAVSSTVTEATGLAGAQVIADLIARIEATAWPVVGLAAALVIAASGAGVLSTARVWAATGRRYRTAAARTSSPADGPLDAQDSWDDLSHGHDPT